MFFTQGLRIDSFIEQKNTNLQETISDQKIRTTQHPPGK
jgi:hypothetical protein